ncbi:MAG TPA: hypothetical protein VFR87_19195 [Nocardioidaceae bacterium]|nr:hypothetical protein [Nocardioidaceae bacterium]
MDVCTAASVKDVVTLTGDVNDLSNGDDREAVNEAEADAIREVVSRFLAGESIASLVRAGSLRGRSAP